MRPGKPLAFGAFNGPGGHKVPHLGLPGNPVSSMVAFELFGRPSIFTMLGRSDWQRHVIRAIARDDIVNPTPRRFYARCIVKTGTDERYYADLTGPQGSGILTSMSAANGLAIIPETRSLARAGDEIEVMMLDWEHA
jgi:molybdopterin molybdotransferase